MSRVSIADMKIRDLIGRLGKKEVNGNAARVGCMQVMVRRLCSRSRLSSRGLVRLLSRLRLSSRGRLAAFQSRRRKGGRRAAIQSQSLSGFAVAASEQFEFRFKFLFAIDGSPNAGRARRRSERRSAAALARRGRRRRGRRHGGHGSPYRWAAIGE